MENIVPEQVEGVKTNTESKVEFDDLIAAKDGFLEAKKRLQNVADWHRLAGDASANFELVDAYGNSITGIPNIGNHLKIKITGPKTKTGEGFDWVKIEAIENSTENEAEIFAMRVRPATNPENNSTDTAHFFTDDATSTFMIKRTNKTVTAAIYGRNEKPNVEADSLIDKARNAFVAFGAIIGLAKFQWKSLLNGIVDEAKSLDNYEFVRD